MWEGLGAKGFLQRVAGNRPSCFGVPEESLTSCEIWVTVQEGSVQYSS